MLNLNIFAFFIITLHNKGVYDKVTVKTAFVAILLLDKFSEFYKVLKTNRIGWIKRQL